MVKAEYKNSIASRKKIVSTFLQILGEEPDNLSVTEIVKRAGINRGTFYLHFKNIPEVGKFIEDELAKKFKVLESDFWKIDITVSPETILLKFNEIISKDLDYYKLIIKVGDSKNLLVNIKKSIFNTICNNFKIMKYVTDFERFKTVVEYIISGALNTYIAWIMGDIKCDLATLTDLLTRLIREGLRGCIQNW